MLYSVCSYSAVAAAKGFKSPGNADEYVLTLLAAAWPRVHETFAGTLPSSINVRNFGTRASVWCESSQQRQGYYCQVFQLVHVL